MKKREEELREEFRQKCHNCQELQGVCIKLGESKDREQELTDKVSRLNSWVEDYRKLDSGQLKDKCDRLEKVTNAGEYKEVKTKKELIRTVHYFLVDE